MKEKNKSNLPYRHLCEWCGERFIWIKTKLDHEKKCWYKAIGRKKNEKVS